MMGSGETKLFDYKVDALKDRKIYGDCAGEPEFIQTHISAVFLTDRHVYKLKRPVDLGFLDFSTIEKRKAACEAEVRVNRRLAPDIYEGILALRADQLGGWSIGSEPVDGEGEPVDWLVKMKRLPDSRCLQSLLHDPQWPRQEIATVIEMLSRFYQSLNPVRPDDYLNRFVDHVRDNTRELGDPRHGLPADQVSRSGALQQWFLFAHSKALHDRCASGHVVEGHGDLRAEHIYLTDPPVVLDGIEFDRQYRIVDVADELCFLAITCEYENAAEVGQTIMTGVCSRLNDTPAEPVLDFYRAYRASVRAKVATLRGDGEQASEASSSLAEAIRYLDIADHHACRLGPLPALIVRGRSGTGKTTLAKRLAAEIGASHFATDQVRRDVNDVSRDSRYSVDARSRVYQSMIEKAENALDEGRSVILDGTFLKPDWLKTAIEQLLNNDAKVIVVTCECPDPVAIERVRRRTETGGSASEADVQVLQNQTDEVTSLPSTVGAITIDTTMSLDQQIDELQRGLHQGDHVH